jgi:hypothetical protein
MPALKCKFWNVGQGLFSSGCIKMKAAPNFHWVYDCGTNSSPTLIQNSVYKYNQQENNTDIDLLVLSHFDSDHISGVKELLKNGRKIKYWVVPYYPLWQRLVIASIYNNLKKDDEFYSNPILYLKEQFPEALEHTEILLLPTKENDGEIATSLSPSYYTESKGNVFFKRLDKPFSDEFSNIDVKLHWLDPNYPILLKDIHTQEEFEFVLYNVPFKLFLKYPPNLRTFQNQVEQIIQHHQFSSTDPTSDLKKIYTKTFGNNGKRKNIISQYLYIRKVNQVSLRNHILHVEKNVQSPLKRYFSHKNAILYTGDGYLNNLPLLTDLMRTLGNIRINDIHCLQVPHHGAKGNWQLGLANALSPDISVFTADNQRKKAHPHLEVLSDFWPYNPIIVNKNTRLSIHSIYR